VTRKVVSAFVLGFLAPALVHAQTQTKTYTYSGAPISIPGSNTGVSGVAEIAVPDSMVISSVTAQVQITYPAIGDLKVSLFSANGTRTVLAGNDCGKLANINTTFDDTAQTKFGDFCPAEAGRGPFRPDQPLANSKGENSAGYWDLVVQNTGSSSTVGSIQAFSITITGTPITTPSFTSASIVNSASGTGGLIAPGELVSIFGLALGPQNGVQAAAGNLTASLGGTIVSVNGSPVPILYSSYYQVNIQIPYSVQPGSAKIQVQGPSGSSGTLSVDVLSSAAGVFTSQTNGRGPALALNQDGTVNSASNPAKAGSYISLYATGLGAVTPPVTEGTVAPTTTLSYTNAVVTAVVGGLSAPVQFAGLAPGYVGLYQINVQVPSTTPSGTVRVFLIMPNGFSSQGGVLIYVQ
jgi:uncharacterized protein (TIGR03437 family)